MQQGFHFSVLKIKKSKKKSQCLEVGEAVLLEEEAAPEPPETCRPEKKKKKKAKSKELEEDVTVAIPTEEDTVDSSIVSKKEKKKRKKDKTQQVPQTATDLADQPEGGKTTTDEDDGEVTQKLECKPTSGISLVVNPNVKSMF